VRDETFLWSNSGDSHLLEPPDLFSSLPDHLQELMPRSVKDPSGEFETVYVDGQSFRRELPKPKADGSRTRRLNARPIGTDESDFVTRFTSGNDPASRLRDLDGEGIWGEVIYPSLGTWSYNIRTPEIVQIGCRVLNEHAIDFQSHSPRFVCCASIPLLDIGDTITEIERCAAEGFKIAFLPTRPPLARPEWNDDSWEPLWAALADTGMIIGFHIGTEPHEYTKQTNVYFRGPGGAVLNYCETTYGGQRAVTQLIASGALDRHPSLRILVSEGGATWGPFMGDRMDEAYRQHGAAVRPQLEHVPSSYIYERVYASFQHDRTAVLANTAMGWQNVVWGSDYPHFEGTFGHTQKTLHELFDDIDGAASRRMRVGAFAELFPHVPPAPPDGTPEVV
jgi:predicted TIM-barrel fold metal-dependent hydrolase